MLKIADEFASVIGYGNDASEAARAIERAVADGVQVVLPGGRVPVVYDNPIVIQGEKTFDGLGRIVGDGPGSSRLIAKDKSKPAIVIQGERARGVVMEGFSVGYLAPNPSGEIEDDWTQLGWPDEEGLNPAAGCGVYVKDPSMSGGTRLSRSAFRDVHFWTPGHGVWIEGNSFSFELDNCAGWSRNGDVFGLGGGICSTLRNCYAGSWGAGCAGYRIADFGTLDSCNGGDVEGCDIWLYAGADEPWQGSPSAVGTNTVTLAHGRKQLAGGQLTILSGPGSPKSQRIVRNNSNVVTVKRAWTVKPDETTVFGYHSPMYIYHPPSPVGSYWQKRAQVALTSCNIELVKLGIVAPIPCEITARHTRAFFTGPHETFAWLTGGDSAYRFEGLRLSGSSPSLGAEIIGDGKLNISGHDMDVKSYRPVGTTTSVNIPQIAGA